MLEVQGLCNTAKVFTDALESTALAQIQTLCNQAFTQGSRLRIMPDVHAGAGCTIGTTMTISDKVVPNLVGVDIGCGMETVRLAEKRLELPKLDALIRKRIPSGFSVRTDPHALAQEIDLSALRCRAACNLNRDYASIGTLGGGNHFIEVDRDEEGSLYLVVHSGSRHLGLEVAKHYQEAGFAQLNKGDPADLNALIAQYKAQGRDREISQAIKAWKTENRSEIPFALAYVSGELFDDYIYDMKLVQRFAALNRQAMVGEIMKGMKLHEEERFTTVHNYIDTETMVLRKGAVSAKAGETLLIPINMRDGSLICTGKGNADWNQSAPHGAGRLMSRAEAKRQFTVAAYKKEMEGVFSTSVDKDTLDECPMAYKPMEDILRQIGPTAEVRKVIKPIYNFKAAEEPAR